MEKIPDTICIVGPDGAGKSTQAQRLAEYFREQGKHARIVTAWDVLEQDEAGVLPFRSKADVDRFLGSVHSAGRALFLHMAMREALDRALDERTNETLIVVGYWHKYNATERVYGNDADLLDALGASFPELDVLLYIDIDPATALARKQQISGYESAGRGRAGFLPFQHRAQAELNQLRDRFGGDQWQVIDGRADADTVSNAIITAVNA